MDSSCTTVHKLVLGGDVTDETLKEKLKSVKKITGGIQINKTSIVFFNYLKEVKSIENEDGYGIIFSKNQKLVRFVTPQNLTLKGTPKAVFFEKDGFFRNVIKVQGEALGDFSMLETASKNDDWYDVAAITESGPDIVTIVLIVLCVFLLVVWIVTCICYKQMNLIISKKSKNKDVPETAEEGKKQHKTSFTSAANVTYVNNSKVQAGSKIIPTNTTKSLTKSGEAKSLENPTERQITKPVHPPKLSEPAKSSEQGKKTNF